jgi:hypothetical protein
MKDLIIPVNNEAHSRALVAVVGEETAALVLKAYQAIDSAMVFGYERSQAEEAEKRKVLAEEYVAALQRSEDRDTKDAFNNGYNAGFVDGSEDLSNQERAAYDDGYVDGVSDARVFPAYADERVAELCSEDGFEDGQTYDEAMGSDFDYYS